MLIKKYKELFLIEFKHVNFHFLTSMLEFSKSEKKIEKLYEIKLKNENLKQRLAHQT